MALEAKPAVVMIVPDSVTGHSDVSRINRELEKVINNLDQAELRKSEASQLTLSQSLQDLAKINDIDIQDSAGRAELAKMLSTLQKTAPSIHISLAAEPSPEFTRKLVTWLRKEINPQLLLEIGLQPTIAAGCIIRTNSKYFDCSMRQHLLSHKDKLVERLKVAV